MRSAASGACWSGDSVARQSPPPHGHWRRCCPRSRWWPIVLFHAIHAARKLSARTAARGWRTASRPVARGRKAERTRRKLASIVESQDLHRKVRVRRAANLVLFVVNASWSMATEQRLEATKGAVLSLSRDAYRRPDRVGLIAFRAATADLVLPPTSSVELIQRALQHIPVGGKTPLSAALLLAHEVCTAARAGMPRCCR